MRKWIKGLAIAIVMCVCASLGFAIWRAHKIQSAFERALPEVFQIAETAVAGTDGGDLLALITPWPIRVCGGAIYNLSRETLERINSRGLEFFKDARQSRGFAGKYPKAQYTFAPWKKSPIPENWIGNKWDQWWGLDCIETSSHLPQLVGQMARLPGSFYTTTRYSTLVVVPSLGVIAVTFRPN